MPMRKTILCQRGFLVTRSMCSGQQYEEQTEHLYICTITSFTKKQIPLLKSDYSSFSISFHACQIWEGNVDDFLKYENQGTPITFSDRPNINLRSCTKSDILHCLNLLEECQRPALRCRSWMGQSSCIYPETCKWSNLYWLFLESYHSSHWNPVCQLTKTQSNLGCVKSEQFKVIHHTTKRNRNQKESWRCKQNTCKLE